MLRHLQLRFRGQPRSMYGRVGRQMCSGLCTRIASSVCRAEDPGSPARVVKAHSCRWRWRPSVAPDRLPSRPACESSGASSEPRKRTAPATSTTLVSGAERDGEMLEPSSQAISTRMTATNYFSSRQPRFQPRGQAVCPASRTLHSRSFLPLAFRSGSQGARFLFARDFRRVAGRFRSEAARQADCGT